MREHRADYARRSVGLVRNLIVGYLVLLSVVLIATKGRPYGAPIDHVDGIAFAAQYIVLVLSYGLTYTRVWPRIHHPIGTLVVLIAALGSLIPYRTAAPGVYASQFVATAAVAILGLFSLARLPWSWGAGAASIVTGYSLWFAYYVRPLPPGSTPIISWAFAYILGFIACRIGENADAQLYEARAAVDRLLDSVYPKAVADRLRSGEREIADEIPEAAILMLDLANFSAYSKSRPASEVVVELNRLFGAFDQLADQFGVTKIKTSGDLYMAVSTGADAAARMASFALALQKVGGAAWSFRIGIHWGSIVAGVVGDLRSLYDVWGDAVNTAARLEQSSEIGRIQVSEAFARRAGDLHFDERGKIELKGIGSVRTFWLS